ncbi:MAG: FIST C-terminal domain-containing protein [Acidimicrobiia bacterium]|nr:FIST C-terminal domain-containing protein [Acidimicrobiia bacterium]
MRFGSGVSISQDTGDALNEAIRLAVSGITRAPDLVFGFASFHHGHATPRIAGRLASLVSMSGVSLGAISSGLVAGSEEFESGAALVVWAAWLDDAGATALRMVAHRTDQGMGIAGANIPKDARGVILLADPYSFPAGQFAESLGIVPVAGGMPGSLDNEPFLFVNGQVFTNGAVAAVLLGNVEFRAVVSQGCEPVGTPAVVTRAAGRVIEEIGGVPAVTFVERIIEGLDESAQQQLRYGIQLGIAFDEYAPAHGRGDFLIRAVTGADRNTQSILIADEVPVGSTIQFHVRDSTRAGIDLNDSIVELGSGGMLMFTDRGRGEAFFGYAHHDAALVDLACQPAALAGMIGTAEIGPVAGASRMLGFGVVTVELTEQL